MIFRKVSYKAALVLLSIIFILSANKILSANHPNSISLKKSDGLVVKGWVAAKYSNQVDIFTLPDSAWRPLYKIREAQNTGTGEWLMRAKIMVKDSAAETEIYGLFPRRYISAYEIYWDGNKIGENGHIGRIPVEVVPGFFEYNLVIPNYLMTPGEHTLVYKISNFIDNSPWKWYMGWTSLAPYNTYWQYIFRDRVKSFLIMGILFIPFLFNIFLYVTRKFKIEHLLFAIFCLLVIVDHLVAQIPMFINLPLSYIHAEFNTYNSIVLISSVLIPLFFVFFYSLPGKIKVMAPIVLITFAMYPFIHLENIYIIYPAYILITSLIITIWALIKKREGSLIILIGIIFSWIGYYYNMAFAGLNTILVICTSLSIAIQFAKKEKGEREAQLKSSRLENELLKKNINSHFLMNTLTSIIVWLRREPESAIKLIEALANEFRMVMHISSLKEISLRQEIELCNNHLKIMNYRKGTEYKLVTEGINEEAPVPPMIFHTLIENGLTHGFENKDCGTFSLSGIQKKNSVQYIMANDGDFKDCEKKNSSGFGLQYIKTRLEESYPGKWKLDSCRQDDSWKVIIEIFR